MLTTRSTTVCLLLAASFILCMHTAPVLAQNKLSIDKVYSAYLRNSGTISEKGQIKGYFFLYQSDKIDRHTDEYTLQILDENLNKVSNIKFQDSKKLSLLESAYNGSTLSFLFKNEDTKTLDMKIYDLSGKLKYTYSRGFDRKTDDLMKQYETLHTDEGTNKNVFDLGDAWVMHRYYPCVMASTAPMKWIIILHRTRNNGPMCRNRMRTGMHRPNYWATPIAC